MTIHRDLVNVCECTTGEPCYSTCPCGNQMANAAADLEENAPFMPTGGGPKKRGKPARVDLDEDNWLAIIAELRGLRVELERWKHGQQIEGDYVCPDSLEAYALREVAAAVQDMLVGFSDEYDGRFAMLREKMKKAGYDVD